jgi:hypothetical protein
MNRIINQDFYDALLEAFRETPGNYNSTMKRALKDPRCKGSCSYASVKKAWEKGWPKHDFLPIKDVLAFERIAAREIIARRKEEEGILFTQTNNTTISKERTKEKAREDAIQARAAEAKLVREARDNVIKILSSSKDLLKIYKDLITHISKLKPDDLGFEEAAKVLWRITISSRAATDAGMKCLQMERLLLGQPTEIIGAKDTSNMSIDDALVELDKAAQAAERIRRRRDKGVPLTCQLSGNLKGRDNGIDGNDIN